jgi:hypothetical protein
MTDSPVEFEMRTPPQDPALAAAASGKPGGWVYEVDRPYPPEQQVPPEAIRGSWEVNADGKLTGKYARNRRYRPVQRSSRLLKPYMHAAAKTNRNQWIVEIDPRGEASFPNIPTSLIRGWWYVDATGTITDQFRPNSMWEPESNQLL